MASYCKECSILIWGEDEKDYYNPNLAHQTKLGMYRLVLCEGCGPCQVDHTGLCISTDCDPVHGHRSPRSQYYLKDHYAREAKRLGKFGWAYRAWDWWNGTMAHPGMKHELRYRWNDIVAKSRGRWKREPVTVETSEIDPDNLYKFFFGKNPEK